MYRRARKDVPVFFTKRPKIFGSITKFGYLCLDE